MNWGTEKKPLELKASWSRDRPKNIQSIQQQLIDGKFPAKADEFRKYATEEKHQKAAAAAGQHPLTYAAERIGFTLYWG